MPIDVIRGKGKSHMVRPGTEMVIKEGRNPDGVRITVFSAMGICGTETTGAIEGTEIAKDVTCERCAKRAEVALAEQQPEPAVSAPEPEPEPMVTGSHGWDAAPVLGSPEVTEDVAEADDDELDDEPAEPTRQGHHRTPGRIRHGKIRYERSLAKQKMKQQIAAMSRG